MFTHRSIAIVLAGLILVSVVPTSVVAQPTEPHSIPLTNYERVNRVTVDNQRYWIYTYESPLPFMSGIAVAHNGQLTEDKKLAKQALHVHARQTVVARLSEEEIAILRDLKQNSHGLEQRLASLIANINSTITYTNQLNKTQVGNRTARAAALEQIPAFQDEFGTGFGTARIKNFRRSLMKMKQAASNLDENATAVLRILEKRQAGREIDKTVLFRHYTWTIKALEQTESIASDMSYSMSVTIEHMATIAEQSKQIPKVGSTMYRRFTKLAETLRTSKQTIKQTRRQLVSGRETLKQIDQRAAAMSERLIKQWKSPGAIKAKIYGMVGETGILLIAGLWTGLAIRNR